MNVGSEINQAPYGNFKNDNYVEVSTKTASTEIEKTDNSGEIRKDSTKKIEDEQLSYADKQKRMQRLQETLKNHNVEISYNEEVNRYAIKVLDSDTKEVVKEIPSEKTLDMFAKMLEIEGLLVDEKR